MQDSHELIKSLLWELSELGAEERATQLALWSEKDPAVYEELRSLLAQETHSSDALSLLSSCELVETTAEPNTKKWSLSIGDLLMDRYLLLRRLGSSHVSVVYLALDRRLDVHVALKFVFGASTGAFDTLLREVRTAREITHPLVCRIFDIHMEGSPPFLSMEYIEGESLETSIRRLGRLSLEKVCEVAVDLLQGLVAAHSKGIFHHDLKPSNIIIDRDGRTHLTDFGIAFHRDEHTEQRLWGTLNYLAPEQWLGLPYTERSELFALSAVLYEALTGELWSWRGKDADGVGDELDLEIEQRQHVSQKYGWPAESPEWLCQLLLSGLSPLASARPESAEVMLQSLQGALAQGPSTPEPQTAPETLTDLVVESTTKTFDSPKPEQRLFLVLAVTIHDYMVLCRGEERDSFFEKCRCSFESWIALIEEAQGKVVYCLPDTLVAYFGFPTARASEPSHAWNTAFMIAEKANQDETSLSIGVALEAGDALSVFLQAKEEVQHVAFGEPVLWALNSARSTPSNHVSLSTHVLSMLPRERRLETLSVPPTKGSSREDAETIPDVHRFSLDEMSSTWESSEAPAFPLVGRDAELEVLSEHWTQAVAGDGNFLLITGEPGIGKTRLLDAFLTQELEQHHHLKMVCTSDTLQSPLWALADMLARYFQLSTEQEFTKQYNGFLGKLASIGANTSWTEPMVELLMVLPFPDQRPSDIPSPGQLRLLWTSLVQWFTLLAERDALCLRIEDLHWGDSHTREFLNELLVHLPQMRMMVLASSRHREPELLVSEAASALQLRPLSMDEVRVMIAPMLPLALQSLPDFWRLFLERADGIPLFVEELLYAVLQWKSGGHETLTWHIQGNTVPASLQYPFLSRLDQLGEQKELVQFCAVLGYRFRFSWLEAVLGDMEGSLQQNLLILVDAGVLVPKGFSPKLNYVFRHHLLRDIVYRSLSVQQREKWHKRFIDKVGELAASDPSIQPAWFAAHVEASGHKKDAILWWLRAGQHAFLRAGQKEANDHFDRALALVPTLEHEEERMQMELQVQSARGSFFVFFRRVGDTRSDSAFSRVYTLLDTLGEDVVYLPYFMDVLSYSVLCGKKQALQDIERCLRVAPGAKRSLQPYIYSTILCYAMLCGRLKGREMLRGLVGDLTAPLSKEDAALRFVSVEFARGHLPMYEWVQGHLLQACQQAKLNAESPKEHSIPALYLRYSWLFLFFDMIEDMAACERVLDEFEDLHRTHLLSTWMPAISGFRAIFQLKYKQERKYFRVLKKNTEELYEISSLSTVPYFLWTIALCHYRLQEYEQGLEVLDKALTFMASSPFHFHLSECHRLRGMIYEAQGQWAEATSCFEEAWQSARARGFPLWGMRAALALAQAKQKERQTAIAILETQMALMPADCDVPSFLQAQALLKDWRSTFKPRFDTKAHESKSS